MWTDGTGGFENWGPGEPNNQYGSQHYATMNHNGVGLWDDEYETFPGPSFRQYDLPGKV